MCGRSITSLVATSNSVSMTDSMGLMSKSEGAPLGGSRRRPLGSWSLRRGNTRLLLIQCGLDVHNHLCLYIYSLLTWSSCTAIQTSPSPTLADPLLWYSSEKKRHINISYHHYLHCYLFIGLFLINSPSCGRVCPAWHVYQGRKQWLH